jgi:opacity protein-like surface antigen
VEGDVGAANVRGGGTAGIADGLDALGAGVGFSPAFFTVQDKTNWMATATARVGYAWGRTLYYAKGGAAFEDDSISAACIFGPTGATPIRACLNQAGVVSGGFSTAATTRVGWTLGFGTEFDLGKNWSAKTEYDYIGFGSKQFGVASDGTTIVTDRINISQVKVGVNYRFGPGVVVAKY